MNRSRQVPPSLRLPKEGSLAALLIGHSNLHHVDRRRLDQNGKIHVRKVGRATDGDFSASQSPREDTSHVIVHIGTNDCSDTNYDQQLVTVSFRALDKQLVRVLCTYAYGSRLEPPYSGPPPAQWPPLAGGRRHMSHHPVAAHRTDGHGTLLAACPCQPGRTSRTGGRSCAIVAFMTVLTA